MKRLAVVMCDSNALKRLCALPFTPSEVDTVWTTLLWKAWMTDVTDAAGPCDRYHRTLFAFMSSKQRHRQAAAAMWALAHRIGDAFPSGSGDGVVAQSREGALAAAVASLSLVPREHAYLLGREWWPRCPEPLCVVTIDDMRALLLTA